LKADREARVDPRTADRSAASFPEAGSIEQKVGFLLDYAVLAPSSHNTQPWQFVVHGNTIELQADLERWLQVADPQRRELYISLGCALENLLVAAERFGFGHEIVFHADADRHRHAATVTLLAEAAPSTCRPAELFDAIVGRATGRGRYQPRSVPQDALAQLRACATDPGIGLWLTDDPALCARFCELVACADRALFRDRDWRRELGEWIGCGSLGDSPLRARLARLALTHLDLGRHQARQDARALRHTPSVGVLHSRRDDRESQIRVGQAFERLALLATNRGLAIQPLSQLLEVPEIGRELQCLLPDPAAWPQHAFRLGYSRAPARRTPRRPVAAMVAS
jgi:nitroreductase